MRTRFRWAATLVVASTLLVTAHSVSAQGVPDFIQVGKKYMFGVYGMMDQEAGAEVLEIGEGSWIKVRIESMDHPLWLNLNTVSLAIEMTPEFEAFMQEQRGTTAERAYQAAMKADLRNLVTAEESFFADNMRYGSYDELGDIFTPSRGVTIEMISRGDTGWSASARHEESTAVCYIFVGGVDPPAEGMEEATPICR